MDDEIYKEVYFYEYCPLCNYSDDDANDVESPCYDCLDEPVNLYSHKPVKWKEKT